MFNIPQQIVVSDLLLARMIQHTCRQIQGNDPLTQQAPMLAEMPRATTRIQHHKTRMLLAQLH